MGRLDEESLTSNEGIASFLGYFKNFSNGRSVRNVFERICIKQAQRADDSVITKEDVAAAFAEPDIAAMGKSRVKIGFAAE
jgi:hypothetical protein